MWEERGGRRLVRGRAGGARRAATPAQLPPLSPHPAHPPAAVQVPALRVASSGLSSVHLEAHWPPQEARSKPVVSSQRVSATQALKVSQVWAGAQAAEEVHTPEGGVVGARRPAGVPSAEHSSRPRLDTQSALSQDREEGRVEGRLREGG